MTQPERPCICDNPRSCPYSEKVWGVFKGEPGFDEPVIGPKNSWVCNRVLGPVTDEKDRAAEGLFAAASVCPKCDGRDTRILNGACSCGYRFHSEKTNDAT